MKHLNVFYAGHGEYQLVGQLAERYAWNEHQRLLMWAFPNMPILMSRGWGKIIIMKLCKLRIDEQQKVNVAELVSIGL